MSGSQELTIINNSNKEANNESAHLEHGTNLGARFVFIELHGIKCLGRTNQRAPWWCILILLREEYGLASNMNVVAAHLNKFV
jgi:hypothetical protein